LKENNYNTALVLCSETSPSESASKLIARGTLEVPPNRSVPSAAPPSIFQIPYQEDPEFESGLGTPLSPHVTTLRVEAKTPGTASNSSAPCHYLHFLIVLWTLVFRPAQIVKFSGVATRVIRGRDCLMLASSENKLQSLCSAHFGGFFSAY